MEQFERHQRALRVAARLLIKLPTGAKWALCVTDEDWTSSPGVFNVYVKNTPDRLRMRTMLGLSKPDYENQRDESHKFDELLTLDIVETDHEEV